MIEKNARTSSHDLPNWLNKLQQTENRPHVSHIDSTGLAEKGETPMLDDWSSPPDLS
jgi:hypothetical protein